MKKLLLILVLVAFANFKSKGQCSNIVWSDSIIRGIGCNCLLQLDYIYYTNVTVDETKQNTYAGGLRMRGYIGWSSPDKVFFIRKIDSTGTVVWNFEPYYELYNTQSSGIENMDLDQQENVYVSMNKKMRNNFCWSGQGDSISYLPGQNGTLFKLDTSGHVSWKTGTYGTTGVTNTFGETFLTGNNDTIEKRDSTGHLIWLKTFPITGSSFKTIKVDKNSNIIIADTYNITKLDSSGNLLWQIKPTGYFGVYSLYTYKLIAIDSSMNIYVGSNSLYKITPSGQSSIFRQFWYGNLLKVDGDNRLIFSAGSSVYYYDNSGAPLQTLNNVSPTNVHAGIVHADKYNNVYETSYDSVNTFVGGQNWFQLSWGALTKKNLTAYNYITVAPSNTVCAGDTITLTAIEPGQHTYQWYNNNIPIPGETNPQFTVDTVGNYSIYCVLDGNIACRSIMQSASIQAPLQNPTIISNPQGCGRASLISSNHAPVWNHWYLNDSLFAITNSSTYYTQYNGTYTLIDSNACGSYPSHDTLIITTLSMNSGLQPGRHDFCGPVPVTLTADTGFTYYKWSYYNFSLLSPTITIDSSITNLVLELRKPINGNTCTVFEYFHFYEHNYKGLPTYTNVLCTGDSIVADAGSGYTNYIWSNGDTTQTTTIFNSGTVTILTTDSIGCIGTDSIAATFLFEQPTVLQLDSINCILYIDTLPATAIYEWYYNDTLLSVNDNWILATQSGTYYLHVTDSSCGTYSDTVNINCSPVGVEEVDDCLKNIMVSNPANDIAIINLSICEGDFKIEIFDVSGNVLHDIVKNGKRRVIVDTSIYSSGIYFIRLVNNKTGYCLNRKFVKL